ncbi:MAG: site-specific integrase [Ignavibacteria bacterium]|nr:site-specific integrase [Ignavibacteria bacterium]
MSKRSIDYIDENEGYWYIRYKDPMSFKWKAVSTKLKSTRRNLQLAQKFRDELFAEIKKHENIRYRQGDVQYAFTRFKKINANKEDSTKRTYDIFYGYLTQKIKPETPCIVIDKQMAEDFLLWLSSLNHIQQNTKFGIQKNFLKFLRFLFEYEYIPKMFIINRDMKTRAKVSDPLIFTNSDRQGIIDSLSKEEKNGNFRTMIMLLMYTGLRPSDLINVTTDQVDLDKMEIKFYSSKIDKWFIRPIHPSLKEILFSRKAEVKTGRLFDYSEVKNIGKAFRRFLEVLNLTAKGYNLRTFRKDFISRSQEAGISINTTALLVGHSNIKTTMTYYTKLSTKHLTDELSKLK